MERFIKYNKHKCVCIETERREERRGAGGERREGRGKEEMEREERLVISHHRNSVEPLRKKVTLMAAV